MDMSKRQSYVPNRSCERCRSLKMRCISTDSAASSTCQRCVRLELDCVYALPSKRKPRKKTETKVAALEKEILALSSIIRKQHDPTATSQPTTSFTTSPFPDPLATPTPDSNTSPKTPTSPSVDARPPALDVIDSGILSSRQASEILNYFVANVIPRFPVVALPRDATVDSIRIKRPLLFLAILATASTSTNPQLSRKLHDELTLVLAQQSMVEGSKSMDLLQALLVTTIWYPPVKDFARLKYQQYAHMIAGIGSQFSLDGKSKYRATDSSLSTGCAEKIEAENFERKRTLLSCFLVCSGIARSMHRPSIFPFARWMHEFLPSLEISPLAASTDNQLSLWIRMQCIMTEATTALGVDDPSVTFDVSALIMQHAIRTYDAQLDLLHNELVQHERNDLLRFVFHVNKVHLHEVAMYSDHDPEDFKPPFTIDPSARPTGRKIDWTAAHVQSLSTCWSNACEAAEIFLSLAIESLRTCPDMIYSRLVYCVVILVKLSIFVGSGNDPLHPAVPFASETRYDRVISLTEKLVRHLRATSEAGLCPIAATFGRSVFQIKAWCERQKQRCGEVDIDGDLLQPLKDLSLHGEPGKSDAPNMAQSCSDVRETSQVEEECSSQAHYKASQLHWPGGIADFSDAESFKCNQSSFKSDLGCAALDGFDPGSRFEPDLVPSFGLGQEYDFLALGNDLYPNISHWAAFDTEHFENS